MPAPFSEDSVEADAYELGTVPTDLDADLGPTLAEDASAPERSRAASARHGPAIGHLGLSTGRPYRRAQPPAASGRRAFLVGVLGITGLAAAGGLAVRAWRGRDWLAVLSGDPFEVRLTRHRRLAGRAGALYVVEGTITNLTGSPKGFFEVRARLHGDDGGVLAERTVYAGHVLSDAELKGLSRAELDRRSADAVFGERMANARVEPRRTIDFQVVFVPAPAVRTVADVTVSVAGVKDVP